MYKLRMALLKTSICVLIGHSQFGTLSGVYDKRNVKCVINSLVNYVPQ